MRYQLDLRGCRYPSQDEGTKATLFIVCPSRTHLGQSGRKTVARRCIPCERASHSFGPGPGRRRPRFRKGFVVRPLLFAHWSRIRLAFGREWKPAFRFSQHTPDVAQITPAPGRGYETPRRTVKGAFGLAASCGFIFDVDRFRRLHKHPVSLRTPESPWRVTRARTRDWRGTVGPDVACPRTTSHRLPCLTFAKGSPRG
ncbi:hypothetical protein VUR80DRAFT_6921 [Thermomyces stellatus]